MKLCVPTNWDKNLLEGLIEINRKNHSIYELYGSLPFGIIPGGRAPFSLPQLDREQAEEYIDAVKSAGLKFNYVMNAGTLINQEYTIEGRRKIKEYISWINSTGADSITVAVPLLAEYIKKEFPALKVSVSIGAGVATPRAAKVFESLGADRIALRRRCNRDFRVLKEIRKAVKIGLCLFANLDCIYECSMMYYHLSLPNHVCQDEDGNYMQYIDYPKICCSLKKASNPAEFIKSRWIRPEDIKEYEAIGYEYFKLVDRRMPTEKILQIANAYSNRKYEGNLADLFYYLPSLKGFCEQLKKQLPSEYDKIKAGNLSQIETPKISIDNRKLDGFLGYFKTHDCAMGCRECRHCDDIAEKSIKTRGKEKFYKYANALRKIKEEVTSL